MREKRERNWLGAGTELGWPLGSSGGGRTQRGEGGGGDVGVSPLPMAPAFGEGQSRESWEASALPCLNSASWGPALPELPLSLFWLT